MTNKSEKVLHHLLKKRNITSWDAIGLYKATRLSAIIYNLRKRGYNIISQREEHIDKEGNKERYVRYIYLKDNEDVSNRKIIDDFFCFFSDMFKRKGK